MISVNGKTAAGWRMDEVTQNGPFGLEMLANPFAIVPKKENADRIELAFRLLRLLKDAAAAKLDLAEWAGRYQDDIQKAVGEE